MFHQSNIGCLFVFLLAFDSAFCAKYRTKKDANHSEIRPPASNLPEHSETNPLVSAAVGSIDTSGERNKDIEEPFQIIKTGQPGYYGRKNLAYRKAKIIYNSGFGFTAEESLRIAHQQVTEKRRSDSKKKRESLSAKGLKRPPAKRRPGYNDKDEVIGRKITQLLSANNNIVNHEDAKKEAVKWYKEQGRNRSARFRARKKQESAQQVKSDSPNR